MHSSHSYNRCGRCGSVAVLCNSGFCTDCAKHDDVVALARSFAVEKHLGKRYGVHPYEYHLDAVARVACWAGLERTAVQIAAYLHDTVEDTDATVAELCMVFGSFVTEMVWAVTGEGSTREQQLASACRKIIEFGESAVNLKLSDRIANVEESARTSPRLFKRYCGEAEYLRTAFAGYGSLKLWARLERAYLIPQGGTPSDVT
jgi:(p)ppGpp synthase/HD superfamily hydrolase